MWKIIQKGMANFYIEITDWQELEPSLIKIKNVRK